METGGVGSVKRDLRPCGHRGWISNGGQESLERMEQHHPINAFRLRAARIAIGEEHSERPAGELLGPAQGIDVLRGRVVLRFVAPGPRHAAAARRQDREPQTKCGEDRGPVAHGGEGHGALRAMR